MAEIRSALALVYEPGRKGAGSGDAAVSIKEITGRDIVQFAAWPDTVAAAAKKAAKTVGHALPDDTFIAASKAKTTVFRIAPEKFLIVCPVRAGMGAALSKAFKAEQAVVTELGHSRTILRVSGDAARDVLARGMPVDLDQGVFARGAFVQTGIHGVAVLCHRSGRDQFDLIMPRNFAVNIYEWLEETAAQFGCTVEEAGA
ncbi:MAG: sarcosine oxidase subunit gamma family protein [Pseudomonadota bacterium]